MRTPNRHHSYRHPDRCDTPRRGHRYRDCNGEAFTIFSIRDDYIYVEYENGAITPLCEPEWSLLRPCLDSRPTLN